MTDVPTAPRQRARARQADGPSTRTARGGVPTPTAGVTTTDGSTATGDGSAATVVRRAARPPAPPGRFEQLVVPPDIGGPRVRLGFLWFFLALAAVTSGRWWTAVLAAIIAAAAGYQTARAWAFARAAAESGDDVPPGTGRVPALLAALLAATVPLGAGYGTGTAGAALALVAAVAGLLFVVVSRATGGTVAIAAVLPALAASSIVLALQVDLWVALFLVLTVSLFDAGNFLLGADATGRWEGPVGGVLGALAVTFTMSTIQVPPLDRAQWWVLGLLVAATCSVGQWVTSYFLPTPTTWVPALRRLDAYLVAGPLYVAATWVMGA